MYVGGALIGIIVGAPSISKEGALIGVLKTVTFPKCNLGETSYGGLSDQRSKLFVSNGEKQKRVLCVMAY